ncbi:MAG: Gfo/Idh/MocA family oxidoreductase [Ectothiorhodospiraceae bacterium]|nr:Gfo/Idh/MocA family oxidoreductase [Ectothiorhodospiraceae bacterium]
MDDTSGRLRWGIAGPGWVASDFVAPAIAASPGSTLVACLGRTLERGREFADRFDVPRVHADLDALVRDPEIDILYVALPNALHHRAVLAAAAAGKHVLCEKPFALEVAHAREMTRACDAAGVMLRVAHQIRLDAAVARAREIVASGRLGDIVAITIERASGLAARRGWRLDHTQSGVVFDVGVHLLDLLQWVSGERLVEVSAMTRPDRRDGGSDDTFSLLGRLHRGGHAVARATREVACAGNDLVVEGTRATLATSPLRFAREHVVTVRDADGESVEVFAASPAYALEVAAIEGEVRGRRSALPDGAEATHNVAVTAAALRSIETRRIVAVESVDD